MIQNNEHEKITNIIRLDETVSILDHQIDKGVNFANGSTN
jgi:hypothetical protein